MSIISEDSTLADGLSTSLFVMGTEEAVAYCEAYCSEYAFDAILVTEDGDIYVTDTIEEDLFNVTDEAEIYIIETGA